jgi:hypothetical protein
MNVICYHYGKTVLCRVPNALGKERFTLGKGLSVEILSAKGIFAESRP